MVRGHTPIAEVIKPRAERSRVALPSVAFPDSLQDVRMEKIYANVSDTPKVMKDAMAAQRQRLEALRAAKGDHISPFNL